MTSESQAAARIAEAYRSQGYRVTVEPRGDAMPTALAGFLPDLLAERDDEHVLVEVKTRSSLAKSREVELLASAVRLVPGWRLDMHLVDEPVENTPSDVSLERLNRAARLLALGELEGALLVGWSGVEGALRHLAIEYTSPPSNTEAAGSLIRRLYADDVISDRYFEVLRRSLESRSAAAHGRGPIITDPAEVTELIEVGRKLAHPGHVPVTYMVDWFHRNYGDPVHHLPFDSGEGGYQWMGMGPYDAREELEANFENADPEDLDEAVSILEDEAIEWMRQPRPEDFE